MTSFPNLYPHRCSRRYNPSPSSPRIPTTTVTPANATAGFFSPISSPSSPWIPTTPPSPDVSTTSSSPDVSTSSSTASPILPLHSILSTSQRSRLGLPLPPLRENRLTADNLSNLDPSNFKRSDRGSALSTNSASAHTVGDSSDSDEDNSFVTPDNAPGDSLSPTALPTSQRYPLMEVNQRNRAATTLQKHLKTLITQKREYALAYLSSFIERFGESKNP